MMQLIPQTVSLVYTVCLLLSCTSRTQGCKTGFYGRDCDKQCPPTCKDEICDQSRLCLECRDGLYGIQCNNKCPSTCIQNQCYRYNVSCTQGCEEGWYGQKCDKQCADCFGTCERFTGKCDDTPRTSPLRSHDKPGKCSLEKGGNMCTAGCRGGNCDTPCPDSCIMCERFEVKCTSCVAGKYGERCNNTCPKSCPRTCDMHGDCVHFRELNPLLHDAVNTNSPLTSDETDINKTVMIAVGSVGALLLFVIVSVMFVYRRMSRSGHSKHTENIPDPGCLIKSATTQGSTGTSVHLETEKETNNSTEHLTKPPETDIELDNNLS